MGRTYTGVVDCAKTIAREEGLRGVFRGWTPLFTRVAPVYVLFLPAYEQVRKVFGLDYME